MNFKNNYDNYKSLVESEINNYIQKLSCHPQLKASFEYSLSAGGKRIRPVMFLACLNMLGIDHTKYLSIALALEFIHTYSLIHDDLPAIDNDEYRRGKFCNHVVFGEGTAILAGDALLNCAMEISLDCVDGKNVLDAVKYLFHAAGINGMINGQVYDIYFQNNPINENKEQLLEITDQLKTGKLLMAPLVMASLIANGKHLKELTEIGCLTGKLFQFTDDLLDVVGVFEQMGKTIGKDFNSNKLTAISVYGIQQTKCLINQTYDNIIKILKNIDNNCFFIDFYEYIKNRNY